MANRQSAFVARRNQAGKWRVVLAALLILPAPGLGRDGEKPAGRPDPLPPGVVVRLGPTRFRHGSYLNVLAYSPDGKVLATGTWSPDNLIHLWDAASGRELRRIRGNGGLVRALAFSPDGKWLASAGEEGGAPGVESTGTVHLWDAATGRPLRTLRRAGGAVFSLAISPDGKTLAAAGRGGNVHLWDPATGKELRRLGGHNQRVWSLAFSGDGKILASADDYTVRLWDPTTGQQRLRLVGEDWGRHPGISSVAVSRDGRLVAGGNSKGSVFLWDAATGKKLFTFKERPGGPRNEVAFSPDGKTLIASKRGILWDTATGKERVRLEGSREPNTSLVFSPDGKTVAGTYTTTVQFWDAATGKETTPARGHRGPVWSLACSPDGRRVVTGSRDGTVRLWETATGTTLWEFAGNGAYENGVAFSPDGRTVAVQMGDVLSLRDALTGKERHRVEHRQGWLHGVAFTPDGKHLAAGGGWQDNSVRFLDVRSGKEVRRVEPPKGAINVFAVSPDGKTLAAGSGDGSIRLLDAATGKGKELIAFPDNHGQPGGEPLRAVKSLAFAPDGRTLASAGLDSTVRLWSVPGGRELFRLEAPFLTDCVAVSPDGRMVAACSLRGKTIPVWEVATGKERRRLVLPVGGAQAVAFSPDGKTLLSGGSDTTVLVWDVRGVPRDGRTLEALWADLADADAARAYRAAGSLACSPRAVPFLAERLRPAPPADDAKLRRWLRELDAERFAVRQEATQEIQKLGELALPALRRALAAGPSPESRRRLEGLVKGIDLRALDAEALRSLRAVEALEWAGTAEARRLLKSLAGGAPGARLTREAKASLRRLDR